MWGGLGIRGEVEDLVGGGNQQEVSKRPAGGEGGVQEEGQQKQSMYEKDTMKHITLYVKF